MTRKAISVTLDPNNLNWLQRQARARPGTSVSELLDRIISVSRTAERVDPASISSVAGLITISEDDPDLEHADEVLRHFVGRSADRTARMIRKDPGRKKRTSKSRGKSRG